MKALFLVSFMALFAGCASLGVTQREYFVEVCLPANGQACDYDTPMAESYEQVFEEVMGKLGVCLDVKRVGNGWHVRYGPTDISVWPLSELSPWSGAE